MVRVHMRDQLCFFVSFTALCAIGILAGISWSYNRSLVEDLRSTRLQVIAALKAKQLTQSLLSYTSTTSIIATRAGIINALSRDINGTANGTTLWRSSESSLALLISTNLNILYLSVQYTNFTSAPLNMTTTTGHEQFKVDSDDPIEDSVGSVAAYSATDGAPTVLQPLIPLYLGNDVELDDINNTGALLIGPIALVNATATAGSPRLFYAASMTVPVYNNTTVAVGNRTILGYLTIVYDFATVLDIVEDSQGLGDSGQIILLGPDNSGNAWDKVDGKFDVNKDDEMKFVLPPAKDQMLGLTTVPLSAYPAALQGWEDSNTRGDENWVDMNTHNSQGEQVSVGYSTVKFDSNNNSFMIIVEQSRAEAFEPLNRLRNIVLATFFGALGVILLFTYPLAHFAVRPIRRLREATKRAGRPPDYREQPKRRWWERFGDAIRGRRPPAWGGPAIEEEEDEDGESAASSARRHQFRIPQKVPTRKHFINDELTDLTDTFNAMTDELLVQYEGLEEKVKQRTAELQEQTILAESANEAKTMFIANVTHELRTPLNGILGMCSLVMGEDDLPLRSRKNLEIVFKSGELLLHLLTDLLTFSKNSAMQSNVKLEEKPFRLSDFTQQIMALFGGQAMEKQISLSYEILPSHGLDWEVVGDINRILQVCINLVSNALKFTPSKGSILLSIHMDAIPVQQKKKSPKATAAELPKRTSTESRHDSGQPDPSPPFTPLPDSGTLRRPPLFTRHSSSGIFNPDSELNRSVFGSVKNIDFLQSENSRSESFATVKPNAPVHMFEFRVVDTGPGVPEHMQEKIFEPFVQGDVGLSRKYGGTGLGLSIVRQLAKLMGGEVRLKSFENAGSTFTLRIPLKFASSNIASATHGEHLRRTTSIAAQSLPTMYGRRSNSLDRTGDARSTHSAISTTAFSVVSVKEVVAQDNVRLVGLSQPFFAPSAPQEHAQTDTRPATPYNRTRPNTPPAPGTPEASAITPVTPPLQSSHPSQDRIQELSEKAEEPDGPSTATASPSDPEKANGFTKSAEKKDIGKIKVLVCEDNKVNQKVVLRMLKVEGVRDVTLAEDGQEGVNRVLEYHDKSRSWFDIILMDVQMPKLDGCQATRRIREVGHTGPIIALTAFADEVAVHNCFEAGMDYFLAKPIKRPQVRQALQMYT